MLFLNFCFSGLPVCDYFTPQAELIYGTMAFLQDTLVRGIQPQIAPLDRSLSGAFPRSLVEVHVPWRNEQEENEYKEASSTAHRSEIIQHLSFSV